MTPEEKKEQFVGILKELDELIDETEKWLGNAESTEFPASSDKLDLLNDKTIKLHKLYGLDRSDIDELTVRVVRVAKLIAKA